MIGKALDSWLLAVAALLIPMLGMIAPLGLAPLLAAIALALLVANPRRSLVMMRPLGPLAALLAAMAAWGAASAAWSLIPGHSLFEGLRLAVLSAAGLIVVAAAMTLDEAGRARVGSASVAGFALGLVVLTVEIVGDFPLRRALSPVPRELIVLPVLDRGAIILSLACWAPILVLIQRRQPLAAALAFALALIALEQLISLSAVLGLVAAAFAFALGWWRPRATILLLAGGFVALAAFLPFTAPTRDTVVSLSEAAPWLRTSAHHRLVIWRFTADRIAEKPLLGWGMDASRAMPGGQTSVRDYMNLPPSLPLEGAVMPLHPHDAILQWAVELGIVGTLLGAAIFVYLVWLAGAAGRTSRPAGAAGLAVIAATLPPLLLSFGVWQAWWQSLLWLAAALIVGIGGQPQAKGPELPAREWLTRS